MSRLILLPSEMNGLLSGLKQRIQCFPTDSVGKWHGSGRTACERRCSTKHTETLVHMVFLALSWNESNEQVLLNYICIISVPSPSNTHAHQTMFETRAWNLSFKFLGTQAIEINAGIYLNMLQIFVFYNDSTRLQRFRWNKMLEILNDAVLICSHISTLHIWIYMLIHFVVIAQIYVRNEIRSLKYECIWTRWEKIFGGLDGRIFRKLSARANS